ncbi:MAG: ATP-binding protein [Hyphomicrobiales bacterium]|nr:AAA family ATPase [Hyphomicrobiales bacterium]MDE2016374.1 ATP-binding protein [Hyphomicrobiales bacterium]
MDPRTNPYAPGAGLRPPELAGRDELVERGAIALDRVRNGLPARGMMLYGLRGVGKTVLLNKIRTDAEARGIVTASLEAPEGRSLPEIIVPILRGALLKISSAAAVKSRLFGILAAFGKAMKLKFNDIEVAIDAGPIFGVADSGDLERDLGDLFVEIGAAAGREKGAFALFVDEMQYIKKDELGALIAAIHRIAQDGVPVTLFGAGLPQLLGLAGRAKSYSERLFEFVEVDRLNEAAARAALVDPARRLGVDYAEEATMRVLRETRGYPYFVQEWGKHCWEAATATPIGADVAEDATERSLHALDASFFRVRLNRTTPLERRYLRAMAELGPGPTYRSGDVADLLRKESSQVAPVRASLIQKGMVYSPAHGDVAFTVPLFDGFMRRSMSLDD